MKLLCILACLSAHPGGGSVRDFVEALVGPTKSPTMPSDFVAMKSMIAETRTIEVAEEPDSVEGEDRPRTRLIQKVGMNAGCFNCWVFGNMASKGTPPLWLKSILKRKMTLAGTEHELADAELRKLHLAGCGDIKRLLDRIEAKRKPFEASKHDFGEGREVLASTESICNQFQNGPFDDGSLFSKTLAKILEDRKASR